MKTKLIVSLIASLFATVASAQEVRYAKVVSVMPIESLRQMSEPRYECKRVPVSVYNDVPVQVLVNGPSVVTHTEPNSAAPIIGMLLGAAIGNRMFTGDARLAGTFLGATVGTAIGENSTRTTYVSSQPTYVTQYRREMTVQYRDECINYDATVYRNVVVGYNVTYTLNGVTKTVVMNTRPGEYVKVITSTVIEP